MMADLVQFLRARGRRPGGSFPRRQLRAGEHLVELPLGRFLDWWRP